MESTLGAKKVMRSLEEVPARSSVPSQFRIACALFGVAGTLVFRKAHTINRRVLSILDLKSKASSKPVAGVCSEDIVIGDQTNLFVRVFTPSQQQQQQGYKKLPIIAFFHGGGFSILHADSMVYDKLCRLLVKKANAVVVSVNYRLAPEFQYPTAYDDCWQALQWIQADCQSGDLCSIADPSQVFLMGDSAGGNISHFMMVRAAREENALSPINIKGVALLFPFFGGVERTPTEINMPEALFLTLKLSDWFWATFLPIGSDRDHQACNVFGPNADDISGLSLPPILVTIGSMDILQDWQLRYVNKLREMGKQVETRCSNSCHAEYAFRRKMNQTLDDAVEFIKSLLS